MGGLVERSAGELVAAPADAEDEALAIHFRRLEDAAAFLGAFPYLRLADGTASRVYARQRLTSRPFPSAELRSAVRAV